jgi:hypothetical protein
MCLQCTHFLHPPNEVTIIKVHANVDGKIFNCHLILNLFLGGTKGVDEMNPYPSEKLMWVAK